MRLDQGQAVDFTNEVVITPEMIGAGCVVLAGWDPDYTSRAEVVQQIIEAALLLGSRQVDRVGHALLPHGVHE